ncbi:MAG: hypothetical protein V4725_02210 [Bacteroidota bacterium]
MKKISIPALLLQLSCATAQQLNHRYKQSPEVFPNAGRGFYIPTGTKAVDYKLLDAATLQSYTKFQQLDKAKYQAIAGKQAFIGTWGESYFTDHFGDADTNGIGVCDIINRLQQTSSCKPTASV